MAKKQSIKANEVSEPSPVKSGGRRVYDVTPEQFIETWQASNSADEVAQKLKMPKPIVYARASKYRQVGINLKKMPRHFKRGLDVPKLNRLIAESATTADSR